MQQHGLPLLTNSNNQLKILSITTDYQPQHFTMVFVQQLKLHSCWKFCGNPHPQHKENNFIGFVCAGRNMAVKSLFPGKFEGIFRNTVINMYNTPLCRKISESILLFITDGQHNKLLL